MTALFLVSCSGAEGGGAGSGGQATGASRSADASPGADADRTAEPVPTEPEPIGKNAFAAGKCVTADSAATTSEGYRETPCTDADAVAEVLVRGESSAYESARCPAEAAHADLAIVLTLPVDDSGQKQYAPVCLRNLTAPHPGAPGAGGGPNIIKGDCLQERRGANPTGGGIGTYGYEVACGDDTMSGRPFHEVIAVLPYYGGVVDTKSCPKRTEVQFSDGGPSIQCAVRL
ncbi:hypothetical protein [Streptomyces sp. NPDC088755]|uniref:hypothetical protein n=1 Tax=Streptomyces sp. NPDC088755 TaxID=3365888 RepID=UPI0037F26B91